MIALEEGGNYMTLGEKIKDLRKKSNISQEELAEKVGVSRQSVTKWESDAGLPDIDNLKALATLFNISIDEFLDYKKEILGEVVLEEKYSLSGIKKEGKARCKEESYIFNKFPKATSIYSLLRKKRWDWKKNLFWFIVEPAFSPEMDDFLENGINIICLVEEGEKQYIVIMHKGIMKVMLLKTIFKGKKLEVNGYVYKKNYKIK